MDGIIVFAQGAEWTAQTEVIKLPLLASDEVMGIRSSSSRRSGQV